MSKHQQLDQLFDAIDSRDARAFASFLTQDCRFRFGNLPQTEGRAAIEAFVAGFFSSIEALSHQIVASWEVPDGLICHGLVSYTRHDGSRLTVPFANVLKTTDAGIEEYLIFADTSALYV